MHLLYFIELDDGNILTGKPDQFDGKHPWVSGSDFPVKTNPMVIVSSNWTINKPFLMGKSTINGHFQVRKLV